MASSRILLLAAILLALASVQARGQSLPPSPAMAPASAPSAGGGNCTLNGAVTLGACLNLQRGRTSPSDKNRCCQRIQGMQSAVDCLCMTFMLAGAPFGALVANGVNSVLGIWCWLQMVLAAGRLTL